MKNDVASAFTLRSDRGAEVTVGGEEADRKGAALARATLICASRESRAAIATVTTEVIVRGSLPLSPAGDGERGRPDTAAQACCKQPVSWQRSTPHSRGGCEAP